MRRKKKRKGKISPSPSNPRSATDDIFWLNVVSYNLFACHSLLTALCVVCLHVDPHDLLSVFLYSCLHFFVLRVFFFRALSEVLLCSDYST